MKCCISKNGNLFDPGGGCTLDGLPVSCGYAAGRVASGAAAVAPTRDSVWVWYKGELSLAFFQATADGYQGYVPGNATYASEGHIKSINPPKLIRGSQPATDLAKLNGAVSDNDPEVVLAQSTGFMKEGPLWNNAKLEVRGRLEDIVRQLLSSGDCVDWFEGRTHDLGIGVRLPDLFKKTGLNFYTRDDTGVSLNGLEGLNTSDDGPFNPGSGFGQTLGRGTPNPQVVINRYAFKDLNNAGIAEELIHEMFHAAGLRGSAPDVQGSWFFGIRFSRRNDLNPEVQWADIKKHCGQNIK